MGYLCHVETIISTDLEFAKKYLSEGQVIAVPTETVYGLAADALNAKAVQNIYAIKQRPSNNPLILHFANFKAVQPYVKNIPEDLELLAIKFSPGPLTFLLEKSNLVPKEITGGLSRVGIRIPSHPLLMKLLESLDFPLAAPSANLYGFVSPTTSMQVKAQLDGKIPMILEGGACEYGLESTIIGMESEKVVIYRLGSIDLDEISICLGYIPEVQNHASHLPLAPGMVKYHYSTHTPLYFLKKMEQPQPKQGYIFLSKIPNDFPKEHSMVLSESGDLKEIARNLYSGLYQMDLRGFDAIHIEAPEGVGLGLTILDRLNRATAKFSQ